MNLVIVSDDFPEKNHQSNVFVEQLVIALCDLGVNVSVIAPQSLSKRLFRGTMKLPQYKLFQTRKGIRMRYIGLYTCLPEQSDVYNGFISGV